MIIVDYFKNFINKIKSKKQNQLLLDVPENTYTSLINSSQIDSIINNMPQNLSEIEKAYYIYLELGKIVSENPNFVFTLHSSTILSRSAFSRIYTSMLAAALFG